MRTVTYWEKLKLQIDNLEMIYQMHQKGQDVSTQVYWQVEYLRELLGSIENATGANMIREQYDSMSDL